METTSATSTPTPNNRPRPIVRMRSSGVPRDEAQGGDARQEEVRAAHEPRELRHLLVLAAHRLRRAREFVVGVLVIGWTARGGDRIAVFELGVEVGRVDPRPLHELELAADVAD